MADEVFSSPPPFTPPTTEEDMLSWLRLIRSRRVGPGSFLRLMTEYGSAAAALDALPKVAQTAGVRDYAPFPRAEAEAEIAAARRVGAVMLCLGDPRYPAALADISDAPPVLWCRGELALLARPAVALVGARNASSLGVRTARMLAAALGEAGFTVVSGLARGIDAAAHEAALAGGTVAVLAGGVDVIYPPENAPLAARIAAEGLLLSEQPIGLAPQARHFPRRNRIVSGLALGVVVVEGATRSGSLITAGDALEQGREVMAVPGHPFDARAGGCNALIRDGATLVRSAADIAAALGTRFGPNALPAPPSPARRHRSPAGNDGRSRHASPDAPPDSRAAPGTPTFRAADPRPGGASVPPATTPAGRSASSPPGGTAPGGRQPTPQADPAPAAHHMPDTPARHGRSAAPDAAGGRTPPSVAAQAPRHGTPAAAPQGPTGGQPPGRAAEGVPQPPGTPPPGPSRTAQRSAPAEAGTERAGASVSDRRGHEDTPAPGSAGTGPCAPDTPARSRQEGRGGAAGEPARAAPRTGLAPGHGAAAARGARPPADASRPGRLRADPPPSLRPADAPPQDGPRAAPPPTMAEPALLPSGSALARAILDRLGPSPLAEDQLIRDLALPASRIAPELLLLELDGKVARQPGGLLARVD